MPSAIDSDATVTRIRAEISENDRVILAALNRRLELVGRLRTHKAELGYPSIDEPRERWLLDHLAKSNRGPLTEQGVRSLFSTVLNVTKAEVYGAAEAGPPDGEGTAGN